METRTAKSFMIFPFLFSSALARKLFIEEILTSCIEGQAKKQKKLYASLTLFFVNLLHGIRTAKSFMIFSFLSRKLPIEELITSYIES